MEKTKMRRLLLATAAALALVANVATTPAQAAGAQGVTANDWLDRCNSRDRAVQAMQHAYCWAYARAVADTARLWAEIGEGPFCIAQQVTADQLVAVARKYLTANPEDRHLNASTALAIAFRDAWPCEEKKSPAAAKQAQHLLQHHRSALPVRPRLCRRYGVDRSHRYAVGRHLQARDARALSRGQMT
jgi:Rap1a immunity proteins